MAENNSKGGYGLLVTILLLLVPGSWALQLRGGTAKPAEAAGSSAGKEAEKAEAPDDAKPEKQPPAPETSDVKRLLLEYCSDSPIGSPAKGEAGTKSPARDASGSVAPATGPATNPPEPSPPAPPAPPTQSASPTSPTPSAPPALPAPSAPPTSPTSPASQAQQAKDPQDKCEKGAGAGGTAFCRSRDGGAAVQASVALVPERGWGLDGAIESLIRAHETAGYVLVRSALPERSADRQPSATPWLGGLLFHRLPPTDASCPAPAVPSGQPDVQLVYLVLESASDGVDAAALKWALTELAGLPSAQAQNLRILGPTFSGSARRLGWLLGQITESLPSLKQRELTVVSGTATDRSLVDQLCADWDMAKRAAGNDSASCKGVRPQLTGHSMVRSDSAMLAGLWRFLTTELKAIPQHIAIVSESSTFYGQQLLVKSSTGPSESADNGSKSEPAGLPQATSPATPESADCVPPSLADRGSAAAPTKRPDDSFVGAMVLPMPSGLSHLRAEWAKQGRTDTASTSSRVPAKALDPISADSGRRGRLRLYERSTINYRDLSLAALLTSICQEGIRYVGLFLTDPADKEFLAQRIALQCPDVRLFTMESELDYLHSKHYQYMKGALIASTYPLYSRNTQWSVHYDVKTAGARSLRRLQFARQADQGLYNATLYSIGRRDLMQEYAPPRFAPRDGPDCSWTRPPVWISAVGRDGLLPLRAYDDSLLPPAPAGATAPTIAEQNPPWVRDQWKRPGTYAPYDLGTTRFALLLIAIMAFLHSWVFFRNQYGHPTLVSLAHERSRFFDFMLPTRRPGSDLPSPPSVHYLFLFAPIWVALSFLTLVLALRFRGQNMNGAVLSLLSKSFVEDLSYALTGVVAMTAIGLALCDVVVRRFAPEPVLSLWRRLASQLASSIPATLLAFLVPTAVVGGGIFAFNTWLAHKPEWVLFLRRSSQTDYELSLLVPTVFLALVGYGWGLSSLRRQQYFDRRQPVTPAGMTAPGVDGPPPGQPVWQVSPRVWLAVLAGTTVAMIPILRRMSTIDHWLLDVGFAVSLWAVAVAVIGSLVRVASTWHRLRQQIFWTTHHPVGAALKTLPPALMDPLRSLLTTTLSVYTEEALIAKQCQLIDQAYADMSGDERKAWNERLPLGAEQPWRRMLASVSSSAAPLQPGLTREPPAARRPVESPLTPDHELAKLLVATAVWPPGHTPLLASSEAEREAQANPTAAARFYRRVQELLALRLVVYLFHLVTPLRETMLFVSASLILTLLALNSYPFQPAQSLGTFTWLLMLAGVALLGVVMLQMRRDPILSGLAAGDAGKLNWDTGLGKQFSLVIVAPILTMLATKIPALSWLSSLLPALGN